MAIVYLHKRKTDNSIYYVGLGSSRARSNEIRGRSQQWTRTYKKHGRIVDIVASDVDIDEARELEMFLIQEIGIDNLCNHTLGGEGCSGYKHSEESRAKMSKAQSGKVLSKETKRRISEGQKGHKNYLLSQSKESRAKISKALKGSKVSQRAKDLISKKHKKNNHRPNREALDSATISRRDNGLVVKELTTNVEFKVWESEKYFTINKRSIYDNSLTDKPVRHGKYKGLNFVRV